MGRHKRIDDMEAGTYSKREAGNWIQRVGGDYKPWL